VHLNDGHQDKHVHNVMRIEEKVKSPWKPSLGDPHRSDETAQNRYGVLLTKGKRVKRFKMISAVNPYT
jgi:hypothetical protein